MQRLAAFIIIKITKIKGVASGGVSALLGITERMFGVNLKLRYPFIGAIIGSKNWFDLHLVL